MTTTVKTAHNLHTAYHEAGRHMRVFTHGPEANREAHWEGLFLAHRELRRALARERWDTDGETVMQAESRLETIEAMLDAE